MRNIVGSPKVGSLSDEIPSLYLKRYCNAKEKITKNENS